MAITMNNFGHKAISALMAVQGYNDESSGSVYAKLYLYVLDEETARLHIHGFGAKDNMVKKFNWTRVNMLQTDY